MQAQDKTLMSFFNQLFDELTSVDSRLWVTIRTLLFTPGQLSCDQMKGKRVSYMRPITLFFFINVIYFLLPLFEAFNTSLQIQQHLPYADWVSVADRVEAKSQSLEVSKEMFEVKYNEASSAHSKLLIILMVPLLTPFFTLIGQWQRKGLLHHLTLSLEYCIFTLLINTVVLGYVVYAMAWITHMLGFSTAYFSEVVISSVAASLAFVFLTFALKRFYRYNTGLSAAFALYLVAATFFCMFAYRLILFEVTLLSL